MKPILITFGFIAISITMSARNKISIQQDAITVNDIDVALAVSVSAFQQLFDSVEFEELNLREGFLLTKFIEYDRALDNVRAKYLVRIDDDLNLRAEIVEIQLHILHNNSWIPALERKTDIKRKKDLLIIIADKLKDAQKSIECTETFFTDLNNIALIMNSAVEEDIRPLFSRHLQNKKLGWLMVLADAKCVYGSFNVFESYSIPLKQGDGQIVNLNVIIESKEGCNFGVGLGTIAWIQGRIRDLVYDPNDLTIVLFLDEISNCSACMSYKQ